MRTELFIDAQMTPFGQQPDVELPENDRESIRIFDHVLRAVPRHAKRIREPVLATRNGAFEHASGIDRLE